jgi:hypothetical protein
MEIAAAILAFIKAVPAFEKIYSQTIALYFQQQEAADVNRVDKYKHARDALLAAYKTPGKTDEELKDIRRALYDLRAG